MESLLEPTQGSVLFSPAAVTLSSDQLVINSLASDDTDSGDSSTIDLNLASLSKALPISAQEIIKKLNELLKDKVPQGIESLKPEDHTPEATADRIVTGATSFFDVFQKQHSDLSPEDLLNEFMKTIHKGIDEGYSDAVGTLDSIGAFSVDGVKDGIEQTKILIEAKLARFEEAKRKELGIGSSNAESTSLAASVSTDIVTQAGVSISVHA